MYDFLLAITGTVKTGLPIICMYFLGSQFLLLKNIFNYS